MINDSHSTYKDILNKELDGHIDFIIRHLPSFPNHAILIKEDGENIFVNLTSDVYSIEEIMQYICNYTSIAFPVGVIFAYKNEYIYMKKDDPQYSDFVNGIIDESSIPEAMRKRNITIYAEALGPYRKALVIPINEEHLPIESIKEVDAKAFPWFPLIPQNDWVN